MKALLEGKYAPIAFSFGFLESSYAIVAEAFAAWRRETRPKVETREIEGGLPVLLGALEPLSMPPCRDLLASSHGRWVALFDNSAKISDPASPVGYMATRIRCRGVAISCVPNTIGPSKKSKGTFGAVAFSLFAPEQREFLNYERSVAAANDGGKWTFIAQGKVQPFEEEDAYKERDVRKRFTPEMLERYCEALGISIFDADFYGPQGLVVETAYPADVADDFLVMSLAEARKAMGLND